MRPANNCECGHAESDHLRLHSDAYWQCRLCYCHMILDGTGEHRSISTWKHARFAGLGPTAEQV